MDFQYNPNQTYQKEAIASVVDLFTGQPADAEALVENLLPNGEGQATLDIAAEVGAFGNNLLLSEEELLQNLKKVQDRNGLENATNLSKAALDYDVEMETGTGKTYVYLRTIFELAQKYGFRKFVILVPSTPIKEGVTSSILDLTNHLKELYAEPFDTVVYDGSKPEVVQSFATSTSIQIMVMSIQSLRGDEKTRVIHARRDKLNGLRPVDYLKATRPVVVMDEPQNMESDRSLKAVSELNPLCTLRYSATHRKTRNVVYRLDPIDAHQLGLVKQIVVAETVQQGTDATPYMKLVSVQNKNGFSAKIELAVRSGEGGSIKRKTVTVKNGKDLAQVTKNAAYEGWRINEISIDPESVEVHPHGTLQVGESIGGSQGEIFREMIRETIREHLRKATELRKDGIKVLSLFFVDRVASFQGEGHNNATADGQFVRWFDELLQKERDSNPKWAALVPGDPVEYRQAYFATNGGKGKDLTFKDTRGSTKADDEAYQLIMRDKKELLNEDQPVRFIFSHSALREGWDNPNVFQICALREMGGITERRQTIGRGLRLPVNQKGERVGDREITRLTIVANESYREFADSLQREYQEAGVSVGRVREGEFSRISVIDEETGEGKNLGFKVSKLIWDELVERGFLEPSGEITAKFEPSAKGFNLGQEPGFEWPQEEIIETIQGCRVERLVKSDRHRVPRKLNKEVYVTPWFKEFWNTISQRTTYRVTLNRSDVITEAVKLIKNEPTIEKLQIRVTQAQLEISRGGALTREKSEGFTELTGAYTLPDVTSELQAATSLTRKTIVEILVKSGKLNEFLGNPNDFITMLKRNLKNVVTAAVQDGVQYEQINGHVYELRELQSDGNAERDLFLDRVYEVQNKGKTDFDYIQIDSVGEYAPEREFAKKLDSREDVKFFMKLPSKFKIDTPVGPYNPDWAIIKQAEDGTERIYMIRETKSTLDAAKRRSDENAKIQAAEKHFKEIGIGSTEVPGYAVSTPENWNI